MRILELGLLGGMVWATACDFDDPFAGPLEVLPPVGTRSGIVWLDRTHHEAVFVTPDQGDIEVERIHVGDDRSLIAWAEPTVDATGVLVMTVPESEKDEDVEEQLHLLDQEASVLRSWDVQAPYTSIALSPDLRRAVLYFGVDAGTDALHNANQVAMLDLGTDELRSLTLNGFGGQVRDVQFPGQGDEVDVGGRLRDIVAFLADNEVVLVDAADPAADQVAVRFGEAAFQPVGSMLRTADEVFGDAALFVRGTGADVAMLTLVDKPDETTGTPGFSTQISLIPVPSGAADFTVYNGADAPYLVTVGGSVLAFTDIRTQQGFTVGLQGTASHLRLRQHETPLGPVTMAIAWDDGGTAIHTLQLDGVEHTLGRMPRRLSIETGIENLVLLDNDRALVGSGLALYVVDFPLEQVTPLRSAVPYDAKASALHGDLLLLGTAGQDRVSTVNLGTLDPESVVLDATISSFHDVPASGQAIVVHPESSGWITVVDGDEPSRKTSVSHWGILLDGALDRRSGDGR
jgi:hypothetical protein